MSNSGGDPSQPAPFLSKTYAVVCDPTTATTVSWSPDGNSFVVWQPAEFARDILPQYFKHNNFSSFVRQLNVYGFRKVHTDRWQFAHENFRRGKPELLAKIQRRKSSGNVVSSGKEIQPAGSGRQVVELGAFGGVAEEIERLKRDRNTMYQELVYLRQQNGYAQAQAQQMMQRLEMLERGQQQMMGFMSALVQKPQLLAQILDAHRRRSEIAAKGDGNEGARKKKRAAGEMDVDDDQSLGAQVVPYGTNVDLASIAGLPEVEGDVGDKLNTMLYNALSPRSAYMNNSSNPGQVSFSDITEPSKGEDYQSMPQVEPLGKHAGRSRMQHAASEPVLNHSTDFTLPMSPNESFNLSDLLGATSGLNIGDLLQEDDDLANRPVAQMIDSSGQPVDAFIDTLLNPDPHGGDGGNDPSGQ